MGPEIEALFEALPTPVLQLSRDGKVVAINRAGRKVFAVEPERVVGKPVLAMVVPDDRERIRDQFMRVLHGRPHEWTTRFRRGDAATRVQRVRAVPSVVNGRVEGIIMFTLDLDGDAARPEASQLHTLLENLPGQFTAVLDSAGKVRGVTGTARTHFLDEVDLIGQPYTGLFDPDEVEQNELGAMLEAVLSGDHWMGTQWHRRADGVAFPARTFASPWMDRADGRILGVLVVGRDASVEHVWRERAHKAERLGAVGEFAASIAAEFDAGLRRVEHGMGQGAAVQAELTSLHAFAESVRQLAADSEGAREHVDLRSVVESVLTAVASRAAQSSVRTTVQAAPGLPRVFADADQLRRLFRVLVDNALDSVEEAGAAGSIEVEIKSDASGLVTRISDSGRPVPEETLHRVFEPFFTTKPGRQGLGLSVARALVRAHDGHIWTDQDERGRVVFAVQIPTAGSESNRRFRPIPLVLSHSRSILVVDDEEAVRLSMRRFLEKVGYEVREAWSGRSALAQITGGRRPELVLTDLRMRDGSGFWFLEELERDFPDLLRKTVIVTGDPDHAEVRRLVTRTGCPVVGKPVELPELLELLHELMPRD